MSTISPFTIHPVTVKNAGKTIPALLHLIKALAAYEKDPDAVQATEASLIKSLLNPSERNYAEASIVYEESTGKVVGFACWYYTFSTWTSKGGLYLEDLMLGKICEEKDLARMDWVVLDWNEPAKAVYKKMGALEKPEWEGRRLQGEALARLARD